MLHSKLPSHFEYEIRYTTFEPSSLRSSAPSGATTVATGRPHALPSSAMNPTRKSSYSPVGSPFFILTRTILWPVRKARFHEPWNTAKPSPTYSFGNADLPEVAV